MAYSIQHFKSETPPYDPLQIKCYTQIVDNDSLLFVTGVQGTYASNIWSTLLCDEFTKNPTNFVRKSWSDLSFLNAAYSRFNNEASKLKCTLSPEKLFILDNLYAKNPKSGSSFISIKIEKNRIKYNILGDSFLFIWNKHSKKLHAYCSMIDHNGQLDLSQPCHCLYNDLTFIGSPIIGEKSSNDCIYFIMGRDLANWFINNYKSGQTLAINSLLSLKDNEEYNKLLRKIQSQQTYNKVPFDKSMADLVIIQHHEEKINILSSLNIPNILNGINRHKKVIAICMAIIFLILCFFYVIRACTPDRQNDDTADVYVAPKDTTHRQILVSDVTHHDIFEFYHVRLNDSTLSFDVVRAMMQKADYENLDKHNKPLYDTLCAYSEFVKLYKEQDECFLKKALLNMFQTSANGQYKILDHLGNEILSTNLINGRITYFRESHRKMITELFIGKYDNDGTIIPYNDEAKKSNYKNAINKRLIWKSFSDMNNN